jgi:epoxyqueuosine reductase QueG
MKMADEIRRLAEQENVPVLGFGPASAMADAPPGRRPEDLLPGALALICFGLPVPAAVYQTPAHTREAVWRSQNLNYRRLDTLSLRIAALLEERGARALPVYGCLPMDVNDRGQVVGYLNQIEMGRVTGIGAIGRNGLLIHPRFGARLMLGGVVTTADLPAQRYPDVDQPGCPDGCRICADACPVGAIRPEEKRVRIMTCLGHTARTPQMSKLWFYLLSRLRPEAAARHMNLRAFDEHTFHVCSACVALCPYRADGQTTAIPNEERA